MELPAGRRSNLLLIQIGAPSTDLQLRINVYIYRSDIIAILFAQAQNDSRVEQ
jgi:hypothetical protein